MQNKCPVLLSEVTMSWLDGDGVHGGLYDAEARGWSTGACRSPLAALQRLDAYHQGQWVDEFPDAELSDHELRAIIDRAPDEPTYTQALESKPGSLKRLQACPLGRFLFPHVIDRSDVPQIRLLSDGHIDRRVISAAQWEMEQRRLEQETGTRRWRIPE